MANDIITPEKSSWDRSMGSGAYPEQGPYTGCDSHRQSTPQADPQGGGKYGSATCSGSQRTQQRQKKESATGHGPDQV